VYSVTKMNALMLGEVNISYP